MNAHILRITVVATMSLLFGALQLTAEEKPQPSLKTDAAALKRWQEMRFGMFIHWGAGQPDGPGDWLDARRAYADQGVR